MSNSYSKGRVFGTLWAAGGFEGYANANIESSYSTSAVSVTDGFAGGFIGEDGEGSHASAFWDLDTSGISDPSKGCGDSPNCSGVAGLTDGQLKSGLPAGFDPAIWGQSAGINNGYPYLLATPPPQ